MKLLNKILYSLQIPSFLRKPDVILGICLSICLPVYLFIHPSTHPPTYLSISHLGVTKHFLGKSNLHLYGDSFIHNS